jgi:DNA-binding HxlR family transcriptional regulator
VSRRRFEEMNCGIAQALEAFGDWWTLLIIRDAFFGARRFGHFQQSLGISTNILTKRLEHLVEHEILERVDAGSHGERYEYKLTDKGRDLLPVLTAIRDWSDQWVFGRGNEPLVVRDKRTGKRLPRVRLRDVEGREVGLRDLTSEPGPGASEATRGRFRRARGVDRRRSS